MLRKWDNFCWNWDWVWDFWGKFLFFVMLRGWSQFLENTNFKSLNGKRIVKLSFLCKFCSAKVQEGRVPVWRILIDRLIGIYYWCFVKDDLLVLDLNWGYVLRWKVTKCVFYVNVSVQWCVSDFVWKRFYCLLRMKLVWVKKVFWKLNLRETSGVKKYFSEFTWLRSSEHFPMGLCCQGKKGKKNSEWKIYRKRVFVGMWLSV